MDRSFGRARGAIAGLATLVAALGAGAAAADARQSPPAGVHVDPSSPTAKEYAVPFDAARAIGRGGKGSGSATGGGAATGGSAGAASPLFGAGITPRVGSAALHGSAKRARMRGARRRPASSGVGPAISPTPPGARGGVAGSGSAAPGLAVRRSSALVPPAGAKGDTGGTSPLLLVGAVLLVGILLGIPLRRLGRTSDGPPPPDPEAQA